MKVTIEEMREEAVARMKLLKVPEEAIQMFLEGHIPVTTFSAEVKTKLEDVHQKVLGEYNKLYKNGVAFYICESWHGCDVISVLYIAEDNELWKYEREDALNGIHSIYAHNLTDDFGEFGSGVFSIEGGVLWRVG